jgi:hypothetical protein
MWYSPEDLEAPTKSHATTPGGVAHARGNKVSSTSRVPRRGNFFLRADFRIVAQL